MNMNKFSAKQCKAINLLAKGNTGRDVAKELSVTPQTVCEWKKKPDFVAQVNKLKMEGLETARTALQHSSNVAVEALIEIAKESNSDETRRKAALDILRLNGFEAGLHESFAWGIGPKTAKEVEHKMKGTLDLYRML
jgi:hypothetical protein